MEHKNFFTITIPKGKRVNFKMLAKIYGSLQTYDYSNTAVAATCRVYLNWGINYNPLWHRLLKSSFEKARTRHDLDQDSSADQCRSKRYKGANVVINFVKRTGWTGGISHVIYD